MSLSALAHVALALVAVFLLQLVGALTPGVRINPHDKDLTEGRRHVTFAGVAASEPAAHPGLVHAECTAVTHYGSEGRLEAAFTEHGGREDEFGGQGPERVDTTVVCEATAADAGLSEQLGDALRSLPWTNSGQACTSSITYDMVSGDVIEAWLGGLPAGWKEYMPDNPSTTVREIRHYASDWLVAQPAHFDMVSGWRDKRIVKFIVKVFDDAAEGAHAEYSLCWMSAPLTKHAKDYVCPDKEAIFRVAPTASKAVVVAGGWGSVAGYRRYRYSVPWYHQTRGGGFSLIVNLVGPDRSEDEGDDWFAEQIGLVGKQMLENVMSQKFLQQLVYLREGEGYDAWSRAMGSE